MNANPDTALSIILAYPILFWVVKIKLTVYVRTVTNPSMKKTITAKYPTAKVTMSSAA